MKNDMKYTLNESCQNQYLKEGSFKLFKHNDLFCCVYRMNYSGNLNGYVAVPNGHKLFGYSYSSKILVDKEKEIPFNGNYIGLLCTDPKEAESGIISLDLAINVHGGLTYSEDSLACVEKGLLGDLWWFGFDTSHSGDMKPLLNEIDLQYPILNDGEYRDFGYVQSECKKLADQLQSL